MDFFVYILKCFDGSYYTGHTDNLEQRIAQHQQKYFTTCYTATRLPVTLVFSQAFPTRIEALTAEQQIKGWSRKKKEAMMRGDWQEVSRLAKSNTVRPELAEGTLVEGLPVESVRGEPVEPHVSTLSTNTIHPNHEPVELVEAQIKNTVRPELVEGQIVSDANSINTPTSLTNPSTSNPSTSSGQTANTNKNTAPSKEIPA